MIQYVLASLFTGKQQLKTMKQATRKPTTPGDILLYEYLEPLDLKINELAELLHVHRNSVSALINNNRKLTTEMAFRLAKVFDTTVDFRLNLQAAVDLWEVENNMRTQEELGRIEQWLNIWHAVKSVQKRSRKAKTSLHLVGRIRRLRRIRQSCVDAKCATLKQRIRNDILIPSV